jgi:hypothetical protein
VTNRNTYILSHSLRVTTVGRIWRFYPQTGRRITFITEFSPENLFRGENTRKIKEYQVEQLISVQNVEALTLSTIMKLERPSVEAAA